MSKKKKIAVLLSGCGVYDGSEIHEAVLTLYAISNNGAEYQVFAPDILQHHVINHFTGEEMHEKRNVLVESARIARGNIKPLSEYRAVEYDGLILPGGFGAAKNLSSWAFDGPNARIDQDVEKAVKDTHKAENPIGALCISPVLLAKIIGKVELTIGSDKATADAVQSLGAVHKDTTHGEIVIDYKNKVVTTPCYMLEATISQIGEGAENLVKTVLKMA